MTSATGTRADSLEAIAPAVRAEVESQFECGRVRTLADGAWLIEARATSLGGRAVTIHLFERDALRRRDAERALDEGCAAWRALVHPNAVTPLRVGSGAESRWVVSPATHGTGLDEQLLRAGPVQLDDALRMIEQLASVLHEAHQRGAAHGAIRPERVQLDDRGWTTLLGCGVAHVVDRVSGRIASDLTPADDQADLARVLLCCLVGVPEWASDDRVSVELVPPPTLAVIRQALSPRAAARYADVLEFVGALRNSQWSSSPATPLVRPQPLLLVGPPLGAPRHRVLALAGVACGVAVLATLALPSSTKVTTLAAPDPIVSAPAEPTATVGAPRIVPDPVVPEPSAPEPVESAPVETVLAEAQGAPPANSKAKATVEPRPTPRRESSRDRLVDRAPAPGRVITNSRGTARAPVPALTPTSTAPRPAAVVALASGPSGGGGAPPPPSMLPPTVDLESPRAQLSISARPWGDIYIDGRAMGSTPKAQLPLEPGPRRIRIVRPGFGIFDTLVVVRAGDHVRLIDVLLPTVSP